MKTTILIFTALLVQISCEAVSPDKGEMREPRIRLRPPIGAALKGAALKGAKRGFKKNLGTVAKKGGPKNSVHSATLKPLIGAALKGAKKAFKKNLEEVTKNGGPKNRILSVHSTTLKPVIGAALKAAKKALKKNLKEVTKNGGPNYRILSVHSVTAEHGNSIDHTFFTSLRYMKTGEKVICTVKIWLKFFENKKVTVKCDGPKEIVQKLNTSP